MNDDDPIGSLLAAGARSLRFNAPLGDERAQGLIAWLVAAEVETVVDLGCGRGGFLRGLAERSPSVRAMGIDTDADAIADARILADGLSDGLLFEHGDVRHFHGTADAAVCIGAEHAYDSPRLMFESIAELAPLAVVGAGIWQDPPDAWTRETFGELPFGTDSLVAEAEAAGWSVEATDTSSDDEWDEFERQWTANVRNLRTSQAEAFADEREAEYERYRGVLGFGWLLLRRP